MSPTFSYNLMNGDLAHDNPLVKDDQHHVSLPATLPNECVKAISKLPKLTREQCGHIRHFHNLASQPDGDWSFMGGASGQDYDEGSYRYQLAFMAYAAGAAHYHRLPALRSVFRSLLQKLISKMLRPEVWGYWYLTSQSGPKLDPDLKELRKPWADPVCKENVMYSGHLLLMVSLYSMLFDDDRYDQEDSIVFECNPMWWGMGPERYTYTRTKLQETILGEMERVGWMGACCEPNTVFIVCNQFPIIATRYNDIFNNTNIVEDVLTKYKKAWSGRGFVSPKGLFRKWYTVRQDRVDDSDELSHSAWIMAFMPWNPVQVNTVSATAGTGFLQPIDSRTNIRPPSLAAAIRRIATTTNQDPESPAVLASARIASAGLPPSSSRHPLPTFGFVAQWLSEVPGPSALDPLLRHADQFLRPTWHKGGLYYPRNDAGWDAQGEYVHMEPYSGNAAIGYARLNVKGGQRAMYERPWRREEVRERVCVEGVGLGEGVDFVRGVWSEEVGALVVTVRRWDGEEVGSGEREGKVGWEGGKVQVGFEVRGLAVGRWGVYVDGVLVEEKEVRSKGEEVKVEVSVGREEVDVVVAGF